MTTLHRFDEATGRYLGLIVVDRQDYAHRTDLTDVQPPDAPIGYCAYWSNGAWTLRPYAPTEPAQPTLEERKATRWEQMKAERAAAMRAPLVTAYGTFDADEEGRKNIVQTAQLMQTAAQSLAPGAVPTVDFTLADNTVVTLTAAQMVDVALLLAQQIQAAFSRGRQVRAAIAAATTVAEVEAITWSPAP